MLASRPARLVFAMAVVLLPMAAHAADPLNAALTFNPMTINAGAPSVMTIEITNPNAIAATGLAASDLYPSGIFNASPSSPSTTCGGTVTAAPGASSFSMSGGSLAASSTCVITVNVTGFGGLWVNAIEPGAVTSTSVPANNTFSTALLIINNGPPPPPPTSAPGVAMSFTPASIHAGKTTTLSIRLSNANNFALNGAAFALDYPQALINTPEGATSTCGGAVTAKTGSRSLSLSGGSVPANGSCRVDVIIRGSSPGTYGVALPASAVTVSNGPASTQNASAAVVVSSSK